MSNGAIYSLLLPSEKTGMQQYDTMTRDERILTTRPQP